MSTRILLRAAGAAPKPDVSSAFVTGQRWTKPIAASTKALHSSRASRSTSQLSPDQVGFVFDIDGVLLRGGEPLKETKPTLELLNDKKIPFMLLTNGGGRSERDRTKFISEKVGVNINPIQIVQSHTPYKTLTSVYERILAVGGPEDKARHVAKGYGFKDVVIPADAIRADPSIWPFHKYTEEQLKQWGRDPRESKVFEKKIDAVMVFNDPRDFGSDVQIVIDLLNSDKGLLGTKRSGTIETAKHVHRPSVPLYFSNNDLIWANDYKLPRLGQGAFRIVIETLYKELNGVNKLDDTILGKPNTITYEYVHNALIDWRQKILDNPALIHDIETDLEQVVPVLGQAPEETPFKKVYMVGDNPASDIQGAHDYGWDSCLVKTGIYQDSDFEDLPVQPTHIVDNVYDAVTTALKENNVV